MKRFCEFCLTKKDKLNEVKFDYHVFGKDYYTCPECSCMFFISEEKALSFITDKLVKLKAMEGYLKDVVYSK